MVQDAGQAGAQIKVSRAMIDAGERVFVWHSESYSAAALVEAIYIAMRASQDSAILD